MIRDEFLSLLRCPITQGRLVAADADLIARVNAAVQEGRIVCRQGQPVSRPLDEGLVSEDRCWLYPINDDIPTLMSDAAISLDQLGE